MCFSAITGPWTAEGNATASPCCKLKLFQTVSDRQETRASYCNQSKCRRGFTNTTVLNYKKTNQTKKDDNNNKNPITSSLVLVFLALVIILQHLWTRLQRKTNSMESCLIFLWLHENIQHFITWITYHLCTFSLPFVFITVCSLMVTPSRFARHLKCRHLPSLNTKKLPIMPFRDTQHTEILCAEGN